MSVPSLSSAGSAGISALVPKPSNLSAGRFQSASETQDNPSSPAAKEILGFFGLDDLQSQANLFQSVNLSSSRTEFSALGDGFKLGGFTEQISLAASFQRGDQLVQLNVEIQHSVVKFAVGRQAEGGFDLASLLDRLPEDARKLVDSFLSGEKDADYFSPQSTADRIASFALRGFSFFEGGKAAAENSTEARRRYLEYITPAIEKGFKEALDILGALPDKTLAEIRETRSLIQEQLDAFAEGGSDQEA